MRVAASRGSLIWCSTQRVGTWLCTGPPRPLPCATGMCYRRTPCLFKNTHTSSGQALSNHCDIRFVTLEVIRFPHRCQCSNSKKARAYCTCAQWLHTWLHQPPTALFCFDPALKRPATTAICSVGSVVDVVCAVCVCVCMADRMCLCLRVRVCVRACPCLCACACVPRYVPACVCACTCVHACACFSARACLCVLV